ncbi:MAG: M3 family oligoendopeptidase [Oscillospiraceae bacterium]|jgi:M3 family oligoendopeptidase|nr:M3 family oligoendopeptidase [Oscillospiraceae bacterium]
MKFKDMPYERPNMDAFRSAMAACVLRIREADDADAQIAAIDEAVALRREYTTMMSIAYVRYTVKTTDEFYAAEQDFFDENQPLIQEIEEKLNDAMLDSRFRAALSEHYGSLVFTNLEIARRSFKPELMELMKEENKLQSDYQKLYAAITVEFDGQTMPLPMLGKYKESPDRAVRRAAFEVEGKAFDARRETLDELFDKLVKNRNAQGRLMGYENYIPLGYDRLGRNCYTQAEVAAFREQIANDLVPIIAKVKEAQRKRIGVEKLCIYDNDYRFPDGNAKPEGTPAEILAAAKSMYCALSPETKAFIETMFDDELFDVLSQDGKAPGGYCTMIPSYKVPFIFSNFNGTSDDVDVLTHEAGHAFAFYRAMRGGVNDMLMQATIEACECHSMSMEFLTQDYHKDFFGKQTAKYELAHCEASLDFIPYGCMVDEFQHLMYQNPDLSPEERNATWLKLEKKYRPWLDFDNLPFYSRGAHWQWKLHIYLYPLYYIDYCMAATIAFQVWMLSLKERETAWKKYLSFVDAAGTKTFVDLCRDAGLRVPYESGCVAQIGAEISAWLASRQE